MMNDSELIAKLLAEIEHLKREIQEIKQEQRVSDTKISDFDVYSLAEFFGILSSPERLTIIKLLYNGDRYFSELEQLLNLGPSSLRHHLSRLMKFGIISQERSRGKYIITDLGRRIFSFLVRTYNEFVR